MAARTETSGLFGRARARYFRNWSDTLLSTACMVVVALIAVRFFQWAVLDAVWRAKSATECTSQASGACWAVLPARGRLILFGVYPFDQHWRAALGSAVLLAASVLSCVPWFWRFTRIITLWLASFGFFMIVMRGGLLGLPLVSTEYWGGLALTLFLFASIMVIGMPAATILALARQSNFRWLRAAVGVFIDLTRSVPLIAIVFGASLIVPLVLPGWLSGDKLFRVVLGFAVFFAAYEAELLRGGFQAIDKGQVDAAKALGMRYWQYQFTILIPQAFRITLPQTVNQAVAGFKDTSYIAIVGFFDMTASASAALGTGDWALAYLEVFFVVGASYFVFAYSLSRYGAYLERLMGVGHRK